MKIEIITNGLGADTTISINGEVQSKLTFFSLTAKSFGSVKCQMTREVVKDDGSIKQEFISYYGGDFEKNDELYKKENGGSK